MLHRLSDLYMNPDAAVLKYDNKLKNIFLKICFKYIFHFLETGS